MKVDVHKSVKNLRVNKDFIKLMAIIHEFCEWDKIHTKDAPISMEELNGKRSVWGSIRTTFGFDADTLQAIEHCKYNKDLED